MTAIRETFEETGLLLASSKSTPLSEEVLDIARNSVHAQKLGFPDFLVEHGLHLPRDALLPFTRWTTPPTMPKCVLSSYPRQRISLTQSFRRFHTHFYLVFLTSASSTGPAEGTNTSRLPTPDGGQEVVSAQFIKPRDALSFKMMPPQFYLLSTLAEILKGDKTTSDERARVEQLARGPFGRMWIHPRAAGRDSQGRSVHIYEGDETRGGSKGRLHRSLLTIAKGGVRLHALHSN